MKLPHILLIVKQKPAGEPAGKGYSIVNSIRKFVALPYLRKVQGSDYSW